MVGTCMRLAPSNLSFKFGDYVCPSNEITKVRVAVPNDFEANVVPTDIPILVGLDLLREHKLVPDFSQ